MSHRISYCLPLTAAVLLLSSGSTSAKTFTESLTSGKVSANIRTRYETVDDDAFAEKGKGLTIRTRLGYETAPLYGFTTMIELEDTEAVLGQDEYQPPAPPKPAATGYAVIADPEGGELNRAQVRYRGVSKLDVILGRQRLVYDNQRFIGSVGWRQDEQTFDALSAVYTGIPDWTFSLAHVGKVNGITPVFNAETNDKLVNILYNGFTLGKISAYTYMLQNEEEVVTILNAGLQYDTNDTQGLRFDGSYILPTSAPLKTIYRLEMAKQSVDLKDGKSFDTDYQLLEAGITWTFGGSAFALTPMLGNELMGSDNGLYALQTPYATKHAFNGWVDQFLVTPKEGLDCRYFSLGFDLNNYTTKMMVLSRTFDADEGSLDFGKETDFQIVKTIGANWTVGAKYGSYSAGDTATLKKDATKMWAWAELMF